MVILETTIYWGCVGLYRDNGKELETTIVYWDYIDKWAFPKIRGTFWGVPIIRIIVY